MEKIKTANFTQGYMCACASLISMNGLGIREEELFKAFGKSTYESLKSAGVDKHDLDILRKHKLI